jgi:glycosyltransferase 2 family protein
LKKRLISIAVSLLILLLIYWKIDFQALLGVFRQAHPLWMTLSLAMVVPLTLLTAWRLQQFTPAAARLGFAEANALILAASVLNMVLPSKMGDIVKAYFIRDRGYLSGSLALSLVVLEKACDMLSLLLWCVFGLLLYPQKDGLFWLMTTSVWVGLGLGVLILVSPRFAQACFSMGKTLAPGKFKLKFTRLSESWQQMHGYFWQHPAVLAQVAATSVLIWFLHLLQIWLFTLALRATVPLLANLALAPLAILAGLLPLTFAGVGTRDAALILFYQPYLNSATAAALGVLCTCRYILPALAGLPLFGQYLSTLKQNRP